ncbi:MAG: STAS domain-containing protein [Burkholderiaceae bacterium]
MVFSLFSRKDKADARKAARQPEQRPAGRASTESVREAARETAKKIDQIESEMIASPAQAGAEANTAANDSRPAPATDAFPAAAAPAQGAAKAPDPAQPTTSVVLGDTAAAMAIDVNGSSLPSTLEEAAILYANGQPAAVGQTLRHSIETEEQHPGFEKLPWLMLFDYYLLTGQREAFDSLAIDFAARYDSSGPVWLDTLAPMRDAAFASRTRPVGSDAGPIRCQWCCALRRARHEATIPRGDVNDAPVVDFGGVKALEAEAGGALVALFKVLTSERRALKVRGAENLYRLARAGIETGRADPSQALWMLALLALRLLDQRQQFEDLSIDYCVTYEVSPPPWEPMPEWIGAEIGLPANAPADARGESGNGADVAQSALALRGEISGGAGGAAMQAIRDFARDRTDLVIDCRELRRLDFGVAGELLNEVFGLRSAGKNILFVEPNYLVYALMLVMGIHDLAEIRRRKS